MDLPVLVLGRLGLPPGKELMPQMRPAGWMGENPMAQPSRLRKRSPLHGGRSGR